MNKWTITTTLLMLATTTASASNDFDFVIQFDTCKTVVAPLRLMGDPVRVSSGVASTFICKRQADKVKCLLEFPEGEKSAKGSVQIYDIHIDSPPHLYFGAKNGSDYVSVNTSEHAAVLVTRLAGEGVTGSKVCHGLYATAFEIENLNK